MTRAGRNLSPVTLGGLLAGLALAAVVLALGGRSGDGSQGTQLAAPATLPAPVLHGRGSDGARATLTRSGDHVDWAIGSAATRNCDPVGAHADAVGASGSVAVRGDGSFRQEFADRFAGPRYTDRMTIAIAGRAAHGRASGSLARVDRFYAGGRPAFSCRRSSRWSAR